MGIAYDQVYARWFILQSGGFDIQIQFPQFHRTFHTVCEILIDRDLIVFKDDRLLWCRNLCA